MKNRKASTIAIFCLFFFTNSYGQSQVSLFEPGLISNGGVFGLTISPDGNTALWVRSNGKRDTLVIMESTRKNAVWSKPAVATFSSDTTGWKDIDPMYSPDGRQVLFQSNRPVPGNENRKGFDIWAVNRIGNSWGPAYHLGNSINTDASESYASATYEGHIYFMKENENKAGNSDIYVSYCTNGQYATPINIGFPINTIQNRESNPFISPAGDYIIFFSSDSTGLGEVDLYISFNKNGQWSVPKNLGAPINSSLAEFCPFVHEKEKRLYFSRQQKQNDRMIESLYFINFDIEKYRAE